MMERLVSSMNSTRTFFPRADFAHAPSSRLHASSPPHARLGGVAPPAALFFAIAQVRSFFGGLHARRSFSRAGGGRGTMTRFLLLLLLNWEPGLSSSSCPLESFQCQEGGQVPRCLGYERQPGCQDDTNGCQQPGSTCRNHTCRCGNSSGPCLPFERFCDRRQDCPDGSDEAESLCASPVGLPEEEDDCESDEFRCHPGAECFPLSFKCDGHPDCADGADEERCSTDWPETPRTPQITPKGSPAPPATPALDPLTITAIVALLITVVAAAGITLWVSRRGKPLLARLAPKAAFKQLILDEHL